MRNQPPVAIHGAAGFLETCRSGALPDTGTVARHAEPAVPNHQHGHLSPR